MTGLLGWVSLHFCWESCYNPEIDVFRVFGNGSGILSGYRARLCHASRLSPALSHTIPSCLGCQAAHIAGIFLLNPLFLVTFLPLQPLMFYCTSSWISLSPLPALCAYISSSFSNFSLDKSTSSAQFWRAAGLNHTCRDFS